MRCLADLNIAMAGNPALRPFAQYMLGVLMVMQRADGGNTIYFLGQVVQSGGPIYFPLLFALKEPIPTLVVILLALILALWWILKKAFHDPKRIFRHVIDYLGISWSEFSLASFIVLYWGYSMHAPLNIGLRHIIPTLPLIYILTAGIWKKWILKFNFGNFAAGATFAAAAARFIAISLAKYILLVLLLAWLVLETLFAAPYFLSYFNEFGGGVWNGYHWVTDSNYDWERTSSPTGIRRPASGNRQNRRGLFRRRRSAVLSRRCFDSAQHRQRGKLVVVARRSIAPRGSLACGLRQHA